MGANARLCQLTIVSQPEPGLETFDNLLPQEVPFQTGGPVMVVPYTFRDALKFGRIGVAGTAAGLPRGRCGTRCRSCQNPTHSPSSRSINRFPWTVSSDRLAKRLASLGLPAKTISVQSEHANIQPTILSVAADEGLDLLVMGGYGHSRLKERVLGGVTREMFRSMTVPTLMSH